MRPANINNIGLLNTDFPTVKPTDRYVGLVVGGSVSSQLAQNWPAPAPRFLEEELNKRFVSPNGKPFLVLNGGDGAWKEPQSFILFSMYATSVDAVITLDGYNEHYFFRPDTEERLERPLSNFIDVNPFVADENFGDAAIGWVMGRVAGTLALRCRCSAIQHAAYMIMRGIEAGRPRGKDIFKVDQEDDADQHLRPAAGHRKDNASWCSPSSSASTRSTRARSRRSRKDNNVKTGLLPPAGAGLRQDADRRGEAQCRRSGLPRSLPQGRGRHADPARARPADLRPRRHLRKDEKGTIYADDIHFIRDTKGDSKGYRLMARIMADDLAKAWDLKAK